MKLQHVTILHDQIKVFPEVVNLSYKTKAHLHADSIECIPSASLKHKNEYILLYSEYFDAMFEDDV